MGSELMVDKNPEKSFRQFRLQLMSILRQYSDIVCHRSGFILSDKKHDNIGISLHHSDILLIFGHTNDPTV